MKIDDKYKWLARDEDGRLCGFDNKPFKIEIEWEIYSGLSDYIKETNSTYSFIKWEDELPWDVVAAKMYADSNPINKPSHYIGANGTDVIGFSEAQFSKEEQKGFHRINAIKYITRYDKKGTPQEDLKKAKFYIDKLIEMEKPESIPRKPTNDPLQDFLTALRNTKVVTDNSDAKIATFYHGYNPLD